MLGGAGSERPFQPSGAVKYWRLDATPASASKAALLCWHLSEESRGSPHPAGLGPFGGAGGAGGSAALSQSWSGFHGQLF